MTEYSLRLGRKIRKVLEKVCPAIWVRGGSWRASFDRCNCMAKINVGSAGLYWGDFRACECVLWGKAECLAGQWPQLDFVRNWDKKGRGSAVSDQLSTKEHLAAAREAVRASKERNDE